MALCLIFGIFMPYPVGEFLKGYFTEAVAVLLAIAFMRMDTSKLHEYSRKPALVFTALCWTSLVIPLLIGMVGLLLGLDETSEALFFGLLLQAIASPLMAAPAIAALMGMESTLVLATMVVSTLLVPLSAPVFTHFFAGSSIFISPLLLAKKLFLILSISFFAGMILRKLLGKVRIERYQKTLDGLNIIILFIFATAIMGKVTMQMRTIPGTLLWVAGIALFVYFAILIITMIVFYPTGSERAITLGFMCSTRNMALLIAATGTALPEITWMYFAMSQFPIYFGPHIIKLVCNHKGVR